MVSISINPYAILNNDAVPADVITSKLQSKSTKAIKKFTKDKYILFYQKALNERKQLGVGNSKLMNTLFLFWSHYLRGKFNKQMYKNFKKLAIEDSKHNYNYGLECLFRFYSYGLEINFNDKVYEDFQQLTLTNYYNGSLYGLEKFWAYQYYRNDKDTLKLEVNSKLQVILKQYPTLDSFKNAGTSKKQLKSNIFSL